MQTSQSFRYRYEYWRWMWHKPGACLLWSESVHECVNVWLFLSIWFHFKQKNWKQPKNASLKTTISLLIGYVSLG